MSFDLQRTWLMPFGGPARNGKLELIHPLFDLLLVIGVEKDYIEITVLSLINNKGYLERQESHFLSINSTFSRSLKNDCFCQSIIKLFSWSIFTCKQSQFRRNFPNWWACLSNFNSHYHNRKQRTVRTREFDMFINHSYFKTIMYMRNTRIFSLDL